MKKLRVAVLMGGTSSEREISLRSGANVVKGLNRSRYEVVPVDFTGDVAQITALRGAVDVIVLALHGPGGEDGRMQGLLDLLGMPYTGSGVLGSAVAMHKGVAKMLYRQAGIPTPVGITLYGDDPAESLEPAERALAAVGLPCIVKPMSEGSTIGIAIVRTAEEMPGALAGAFRYDREVLVEQFVTGVEISVPVLGALNPRALPEIEIVPRSGFYDYEMKYTPGATEEICPARISAAARELAADYAVRAHRVLQCRAVSRTDMIVCGDAVTVLETNTLPGMTDTSLLPLSARTTGITFPELLDRLIADALGSAR
ncbi:MAG: D-alanine--D-alanine ligase family protein [Armatimonadota bacterium]